MSLRSSHEIKAEALRLGFSACGIAKAEPVDTETAASFQNWLSKGGHATMQYMEHHEDKRLNPQLLMPNVKSIISVALNYTPSHPVKGFANYAIGKDYHDIVKQKLFLLAAFIYGEDTSPWTKDNEATPFRAFTDSAPVLERYWATKAGIGFVGKNHQLIIPGMGSQFFLGELFVDIELDYDKPCQQHCGNCHRCIDACPTGALGTTFNAIRCLSFLTIEHRGEIPEEAAKRMGGTFYGCDRCQQVCPWNAKSIPNTEPLLQPTEELLAMKEEDWKQLSLEQYRILFKGSAVKRAKYEGLMRNIKASAMNKINKDRVLAALVRTFFKYFLTGIMEGKDINDAKAVKQTLIEYYEQVSKIYNQEAFYAFARMNYEAMEIEKVLHKNPTNDFMQLVRIACRSESFYNAMVEEYKRHFLLLLEGRLATTEEANLYTPCAEAGMMDETLAIDLINRMAQNAYHEACKLVKG